MPHRRPFGAAFATVHVVSTGPPWRWLREIFATEPNFSLREAGKVLRVAQHLRRHGRRAAASQATESRRLETLAADRAVVQCARVANCVGETRERGARARVARDAIVACGPHYAESCRRVRSSGSNRETLAGRRFWGRGPKNSTGRLARSRGALAAHMPTLDRALCTSLHLEREKLC